MATDTAKAKKQMRQSNQIEARPVPVYCLSDVRRADIHWERVCVEAHETTCCPNVPYSIINKLLILNPNPSL